MHRLLYKERGSAAKLPCIACAAEGKGTWAYQYTENEIRTPEGTPYSLDIWNDYAPMCPPCHATLDWQDPERRRRGEETLRKNAKAAGILGGAARTRRLQTDPKFAKGAQSHGKWLGSHYGKIGGATRAARYYTDPEYAKVVRAAAATARAARAAKKAADPDYLRRKEEKEKLKASGGKWVCDSCGFTTNGSGMASHQRHAGHSGKSIPSRTPQAIVAHPVVLS